MIDRRLPTLRAALGFLQLPPRAPELRLLHRWLDTWTGVGLVVGGFERQGLRFSLSHISEGEWRAYFMRSRAGWIRGGKDSVASSAGFSAGGATKEYIVGASPRALAGLARQASTPMAFGLTSPTLCRNARRGAPAGVSQMEEQALRVKVREVLQAGKLPNRRPDGTSGRLFGAACAVCDLPVEPDQMEFEIAFAHDGDNPGLDKYYVHIRCFAAWEFERKEERPLVTIPPDDEVYPKWLRPPNLCH